MSNERTIKKWLSKCVYDLADKNSKGNKQKAISKKAISNGLTGWSVAFLLFCPFNFLPLYFKRAAMIKKLRRNLIP